MSAPRTRKAARQVKLAISQARGAHAQGDAKRLANPGREMGIAMSIDGETLDASVAQGTLDRGTCLSGIEQDRLIPGDCPLVENMGVGTNRCRAASGIKPGGP